MNGVLLVRRKNTFSALMVVRGLLLELEYYIVLQVLFVLLKLTVSRGNWDVHAKVLLEWCSYEFENEKTQQVSGSIATGGIKMQ